MPSESDESAAQPPGRGTRGPAVDFARYQAGQRPAGEGAPAEDGGQTAGRAAAQGTRRATQAGAQVARVLATQALRQAAVTVAGYVGAAALPVVGITLIVLTVATLALAIIAFLKDEFPFVLGGVGAAGLGAGVATQFLIEKLFGR